jgi:hypothetical protein
MYQGRTCLWHHVEGKENSPYGEGTPVARPVRKARGLVERQPGCQVGVPRPAESPNKLAGMEKGMKTSIKFVPLVVFAAVVAGCADSTSPVAPGAALPELVDGTKRVNADQVNARVFGTFAIQVGTASLEVITSGPANFPGTPKDGPGTCVDGRWFNSQGKGTSGSLTKPHPHCLRSSVPVTIVLEPISARYSDPGNGQEQYSMDLAQGGGDGSAAYIYETHPVSGDVQKDQTVGKGVVQAYAIDASTLGTTNRRVGILTIDMTQFNNHPGDLFSETCEVAAAVRCLDYVLTASYAPLASPDGLGVAQPSVLGFLYWTAAESPFNYNP